MTAETVETVDAAARSRSFFGEPRALAYLSFTEAWERFSYYGMTAILVLYMSQQLLLPGHVEQIAGFGGFRAAIESVFGPKTSIGLAALIMGLYTGFIYFTPVLGGWVADRWLGRRLAVIIGAVLMSGGHLAMAFDQSFLLALALLITGCGLLKGNISTQVGELYAENDGEGRTRGLRDLFHWHQCRRGRRPADVRSAGAALWLARGFRTGGRVDADRACDLFGGLALSARRSRPARGEGPAEATADCRRLAHRARHRAGFASSRSSRASPITRTRPSDLCGSTQKVDLDLLGFHFPAAWFNSIDPMASIIAVPVVVRGVEMAGETRGRSQAISARSRWAPGWLRRPTSSWLRPAW